jgi:hypothetical protein
MVTKTHTHTHTRTHAHTRIARAYCGEVADPKDVNERFVSLTTLGSPHKPPEGESFWAKADQTRGLLSYGTGLSFLCFALVSIRLIEQKWLAAAP